METAEANPCGVHDRLRSGTRQEKCGGIFLLWRKRPAPQPQNRGSIVRSSKNAHVGPYPDILSELPDCATVKGV